MDVPKEKVDEIRNVISSVTEFEKPKVYTWEFFARTYGDPFTQTPVTQFVRASVIGVYLVSME